MPVTNWRPTVLILGETCLLLGAVVLGIYVRLGSEAWWLLEYEGGWPKAFLIVAVCQITLHYSDLYDLRGVTGFHDLTVRLMSALGTTSLILAVLYYLAPHWIIGRGVFVIAVAFMITFVIAWRAAFAWLTRRVSPRSASAALTPRAPTRVR